MPEATMEGDADDMYVSDGADVVEVEEVEEAEEVDEDEESLGENGHENDIPGVQTQPRKSAPKMSSRVNKYSYYTYNSLIDLLLEPQNLSSEDRADIARVLKIRGLDMKQKNNGGNSTKSKNKVYHPETPAEFNKLLRGTSLPPDPARPIEEDIHSWGPKPPRIDTTGSEFVHPMLFLRLGDLSSKSRNHGKDFGILSASPDLPLYTPEQRGSFLQKLTFWRTRSNVQGICCASHMSMITSDHILGKFKGGRNKTRNLATWIYLINGNAQLAAGFSILNATDEMEYYKVDSLYGAQEKYPLSFHKYEYVIPYCVVPDAVITKYRWRHVERWMKRYKRSYADWYKMIAGPAYLAHEKTRLAALEANPNMYVGVKSIFVDSVETEDLENYFSTPIKKPRAPRAIQREPEVEVDASASDENPGSDNMERRWVIYGQSPDAAT